MNTALSTERTSNHIATEINSIKNQTRKMLLYNSIEIGRLLVEAKTIVEYGEWGKWLKESVDYSQSTANNLMRIFEEYGANQITFFEDNAKSQALGNLTYTQAVALLGVPEEERETFIEEHDVDNMSTRELQAAIKENEQLKRKLESAEKTAEADARISEQVLQDAQAELKMLQDALEKERDKSKKEVSDLQTTVSELKKQISEAQASGDNEEVESLLNTLQKSNIDLEEARKKVEELEEQLKEKPIGAEVKTVIEKIPEEVEKELTELRKKAAQQNPAAIKFQVVFDSLVNNFQELLETLAEIGEADTEARKKYTKAVSTLIEIMQERL